MALFSAFLDHFVAVFVYSKVSKKRPVLNFFYMLAINDKMLFGTFYLNKNLSPQSIDLFKLTFELIF